MATAKTNRIAGIVLQYGQMGLSILVSLIYTPAMLSILGQTEYGIYSLASSIISYLNLLSLGFGASYIRFYSRYKQENDTEGIKRLNGLFMIVFVIMGVVALIAGLFIAFHVSWFFNDTYTENDLYIAKILMLFLSVNMAISFPASVFTSYVTSQERFIFQKVLNIGKTVLSPCLCIVFLFMGYGSIGMVAITTFLSITIDIINIVYCLKCLGMRFSFRHPNFALLKEIAIFSVFIAINQIIDQINWQTDKIILGKMMNATAVAIYAVAANINTMYINFSTAISGVFAPKIHRIVNAEKPEQEKNQELTDLFIKVGRVQFFVMMLILTGFIFFGQYFISRWAGEGYEESYYVVLLLICPGTISLIQNTGIEIQRAKNKHQFRSIVYLIMAILNVGMSIVFCYFWGVIGVTLGTTISFVVANGIIMNIYYHKKIGINIIQFWKEIAKALPSLILPVACGIAIMCLVSYSNIAYFILWILVYSAVYALSVYFLGLNQYEKGLIHRFLSKLKPKKKEHQ